MEQLTWIEPGRLEWWDVPAPRLEHDGEALVRPLAVARCDLDLHIHRGGYRLPGPFAFGHEIAGEVVEIGDAVTAVRPSDRVVVPFQINCGRCTPCLRGWTNACSAVPPLASYGLGTHPDGDWGGGFSDLLRVPFADAMLLTVPDAISLEAAAGLGDNVADGYRTVAPLIARFPDEPVLVVGGLAQSVGLYAVLAALAAGAPEVHYTDFDAGRVAIASAAGARAERLDYEAAHAHERTFLITVDASATPAGLAYALRSTAACGHCTGVSGGSGGSVPLPLPGMYLRGATFEVSRVHSRATLPDVVRCVCDAGLDPLAFAAPALDFREAPEAMAEPAPKLVFRRG
ncbi:MAG: alcohol dehydrogenase catalytic domain-containing protein [Pseudomonadales bacterium]|jgi:alcohol dehydrogenase|nr:alcohol dehydrogenase catalytic domain-containing protein [Pseudomonadales bacterium]